MIPVRQLATAVARGMLLLVVCAILFLLIFAMGNPPSDQGSEPAWTEVMAWSFLHGQQWGRDIVYTYGPLSFLQPYTFYVDGMYLPFAVGQVLLPLAFVVAIAVRFSGAGLLAWVLFLAAYLCSVLVLPGDIAWALTMLYGVTALIDRRREMGALAYYAAAALLAAPFAVFALSKFTLVPLWFAGVAALAAALLGDRRTPRALLSATLFAAVLVLVWMACGQQLGNLVPFLTSSSRIAAGYGHAMGLRAPFSAEYAGIAVLIAFVTLCLRAAWVARREPGGVVVASLAALAAALFWRAFFTRGDHWPWFFGAFALLPFVLLRSSSVPRDRWLSRGLIAIVVASSVASLIAAPTRELPDLIWAKLHDGIENLGRLPELGELRAAQWHGLAITAELPRIRAAVGSGRIDVLNWDQVPVLLNGFHFAPRPIFQSHVAFTPELAQLNAAYFLGSNAPNFVMIKFDPMDRHLPSSEDGLALIALFQHYRPRLSERGFLLLQRDSLAAEAVPAGANRHLATQLGSSVELGSTDGPTRIAIHIELNAFGKLYTLAFREPALNMTIKASNGSTQTYRLVRQSAAGGFIVSPLVQSGADWLRLYLNLPLDTVKSIAIDTETTWDRQLFDAAMGITLQATQILHGRLADADSGILDGIFPGFNVLPETTANPRVISEGGSNALFLHAPDKLTFRLRPGNYDIVAGYGIEDAALSQPDCKDADGIGASVVLTRAGLDSQLWHGQLNPFRAAGDRGQHPLQARFVDIYAGDVVEYRVDAGPRADTSCDWSYVRNFRFRRLGEAGSGALQRDRPFVDGFERNGNTSRP